METQYYKSVRFADEQPQDNGVYFATVEIKGELIKGKIFHMIHIGWTFMSGKDYLADKTVIWLKPISLEELKGELK